MLEMLSLGVFFGKRSCLLLWQKGNFIFAGKRNTIFTKHTENIFPCIFSDHLSFSVHIKNIFSGKRNAIFPDDRRKFIFQCEFYGKTIFSKHLKNILYFHIFFLILIIFHFPPKQQDHISRKKIIIFYKKDHIPVQYF